MSNLTIKDIAELAGVAKSTVSKYLNGGSVSETTKIKTDPTRGSQTRCVDFALAYTIGHDTVSVGR